MMYKLDTDGCLSVSGQGLSFLYELPIDIRELICRNNKLTSLPELPNNLRVLYCGSNKLTSLPKLPDSLYVLNCYENNITYLPELPESLEILYCINNPLECIIPYKFLRFLHSASWMVSYYYPYIGSYSGQKNILTKQPEMVGELIKQTKILDVIREEFSYLINGCELNLL